MSHHPEEDRREQILDAMLRVFAQKGFSFYGPGSHRGFSSAAGISRGTRTSQESQSGISEAGDARGEEEIPSAVQLSFLMDEEGIL